MLCPHIPRDSPWPDVSVSLGTQSWSELHVALATTRPCSRMGSFVGSCAHWCSPSPDNCYSVSFRLPLWCHSLCAAPRPGKATGFLLGRAAAEKSCGDLHVLTSSVLGSPWAAPAALPWPRDCYSPVPCPCPHLRTGLHGLGRADVHPREDAEGAPTLQSRQKVGYQSQDSMWRGTSVFTHTHTHLCTRGTHWVGGSHHCSHCIHTPVPHWRHCARESCWDLPLMGLSHPPPLRNCKTLIRAAGAAKTTASGSATSPP